MPTTRKKLPPVKVQEAEEVITEQTEEKITRLIEAGKATRWQKGQSGRPPTKALEITAPEKTNLTTVLAETLGVVGARALAKSLISLATGPKPNLNAIIYIYDRLEGKPRQTEPENKEKVEPLILIMNELMGKNDNGTKQLPEPPTIDATFSVQEVRVQEGDS